MLIPLIILIVTLAGTLSASESTNASVKLDGPPASILSRMDEVSPRFHEPSVDNARVMPVGSGDLSAMVRYGTDLEIHLSKTDFLAREQKPYHLATNIQSPGHVTLSFGIAPLAVTGFEQKLDLVRGSILTSIRTAEGEVRAEIFGVMGRNTLIVAVNDSRHRPLAAATYSIWRPEMILDGKDGRIVGHEVHEYDEAGNIPKALSVTKSDDKLFHLGCSPAIAFADEKGAIPVEAKAQVHYQSKEEHSLNMTPGKLPSKYWVVISAATSYDGKPEIAATALLDEAVQGDKSALLASHLEWWQRYWQASWIDLRGTDADHLTSLWYTGYYSYASVAEGPLPPKFNGGAGIILRDNRSWGWGYWWQNTREMIWPLLTGDHSKDAKAYLDFYDQTFNEWKDYTATRGKIGIRMDEWMAPKKPGTLRESKKVSTFNASVLANAIEDKSMENRPSGFNTRSIAQSAEFTQLLFDYIAYTGDTAYLKSTVSPWLKETTLFWLSWLRKGDDGLYHSMVTDGAETWRKIKDSAIDLSAARYCFLKTLSFGKDFGYEPALLDAVRERLNHLAPLPTGSLVQRNVTLPGDKPGDPLKTIHGYDVDRSGDCFVAMGDLYDDRNVHNGENPELYIVHPFAMVDANSSKADYDRAVNTFRKRRCKNNAGWSQCSVEAARLRLDETPDVIADFIKQHQHYPYGGWNSPAGNLEGSLSGAVDTPYFDANGVFLTAIQESLLQSHLLTMDEKGDPLGIGPIVLVPAAGKEWTGRFRLLARGGFLVTAEFAKDRKPLSSVIECRLGGLLRLSNPYGDCRVTRAGKTTSMRDLMIVLESKPGEIISFDWTKSP
jgi:hypothetical protein